MIVSCPRSNDPSVPLWEEPNPRLVIGSVVLNLVQIIYKTPNHYFNKLYVGNNEWLHDGMRNPTLSPWDAATLPPDAMPTSLYFERIGETPSVQDVSLLPLVHQDEAKSHNLITSEDEEDEDEARIHNLNSSEDEKEAFTSPAEEACPQCSSLNPRGATACGVCGLPSPEEACP
jgi:hypothetical protein